MSGIKVQIDREKNEIASPKIPTDSELKDWFHRNLSGYCDHDFDSDDADSVIRSLRELLEQCLTGGKP